MYDESERSGCGPEPSGARSGAQPLKQQVFEYVRAAGQAPRMDVARMLEISPGSVTALTSDLIAQGFLEEVEGTAREAGRGRPPVALQVAEGAGLVVGMKLADKMHSAVLVDMAGRILAEAEEPCAGRRQSYGVTVDEADRLLTRLLDSAGRGRGDVAAVGVGLPGIVDAATGCVPWSPIVAETDADLGGCLADHLGLPVHLDNDANVLTLAELWFGAGRAMSDFAVVTIEHGVGMGLVLDGKLYRGSQGLGLELGHTKVHLDGALCRCGRRGCLEAYIADYALVREAATALGEDRPGGAAMLETLYAEAKAGHEAAQAIFRRAGRYLALGLANVVQLFDPAKILLSGERLRYEYLYADEVMAEMARMSLPVSRDPVPVEIHAWGGRVWARGAAALALDAVTEERLGRA
ncbi:ROK family protein [Aestuariibius sp. 2305UL40-4]|uniref:ROK family protein n=1 Tax=Aestuariibius violaceus TaxID=3234132 RepID=UPI00345EAFDD